MTVLHSVQKHALCLMPDQTHRLYAAAHLLLVSAFCGFLLVAVPTSVNDLVRVQLDVTRLYVLPTSWRSDHVNCIWNHCTQKAIADIKISEFSTEETCNALAVATSPSFTARKRFWMPVPIFYLLVGFETVTVIGHLWEWNRWAEYSISASIMTVALAGLARITDVYAHIGLVMMTAATMLCGYVAERPPLATATNHQQTLERMTDALKKLKELTETSNLDDTSSLDDVKIPISVFQSYTSALTRSMDENRTDAGWFNRFFFFGCVFFVFTWVILLGNFFLFMFDLSNEQNRNILNEFLKNNETFIKEEDGSVSQFEELPWWFPLLVLPQLLSFSTFPVLMLLQKHNKPTNRESSYAFLSFVSKALLLGIVCFGLTQPKFESYFNGCIVEERKNGEKVVLALLTALTLATGLYVLYVRRNNIARGPATKNRRPAKPVDYFSSGFKLR
jgi:hypothetical protein